MAVFSTFARRRSQSSDQVKTRSLSRIVRGRLPPRFEAVGEALVTGTNVTAACWVVGRDVARDGAALGEALDGLRATYAEVLHRAPEFDATQALSLAWSEATLEYLHQLSCEDPLTGLATLAHVRTRLAELYREAERIGISLRASHAMVVVEMISVSRGLPEDRLTRTLRLVRATEVLRTVFSGGETIGRTGFNRVVAVVPRRVDLGSSTGAVRDLLREVDLHDNDVRVWIEGLPDSGDSAVRLLDELARPS